MRILDRYLLRTFLMPWLTSVIGFSFLFVIVDLVESLETFLEAGVSGGQIFIYYLRFLPSLWVYIGPVTLLLGLLYTLYQLTRNNEVIAMRASGISIYRILLPFVVLGLVISLLSTYVSRTLAPKNLAWTQEYIEQMKNPEARKLEQLLFRDNVTGRTWNIGSLDLDAGTMTKVIVKQFRANQKLEYAINANRAEWRDGYWFFYEATLQGYSNDGYRLGIAEERDILPRPDFQESPERIVRDITPFELLSSSELRGYLRDQPSASDQTRAHILTELNLRLAQPWMCLVTMLMAAPFGTQTARKGVFVGVALCLLLFFGLFFMMSLFKALGLGGQLSPAVAGWTPTVLFGFVGMVMIRKLR